MLQCVDIGGPTLTMTVLAVQNGKSCFTQNIVKLAGISGA